MTGAPATTFHQAIGCEAAERFVPVLNQPQVLKYRPIWRSWDAALWVDVWVAITVSPALELEFARVTTHARWDEAVGSRNPALFS